MFGPSFIFLTNFWPQVIIFHLKLVRMSNPSYWKIAGLWLAIFCGTPPNLKTSPAHCDILLQNLSNITTVILDLASFFNWKKPFYWGIPFITKYRKSILQSWGVIVPKFFKQCKIKRSLFFVVAVDSSYPSVNVPTMFQGI